MDRDQKKLKLLSSGRGVDGGKGERRIGEEGHLGFSPLCLLRSAFTSWSSSPNPSTTCRSHRRCRCCGLRREGRSVPASSEVRGRLGREEEGTTHRSSRSSWRSSSYRPSSTLWRSAGHCQSAYALQEAGEQDGLLPSELGRTRRRTVVQVRTVTVVTRTVVVALAIGARARVAVALSVVVLWNARENAGRRVSHQFFSADNGNHTRSRAFRASYGLSKGSYSACSQVS